MEEFIKTHLERVSIDTDDKEWAEFASRFEFKEVMGDDESFVVGAVELQTDQNVVLKIYDGEEEELAANEFRVMEELRKFNIEGVLRAVRLEKVLCLSVLVTEWDTKAGHDINLFDLPEAISQLVRILDNIHALGFAHCDVKPANILWNPETKRLTLIDWENCKNGVLNKAGGTHMYMNEERLSRGVFAPVDIQMLQSSDRWAMGTCIVECITGEYMCEDDDEETCKAEIAEFMADEKMASELRQTQMGRFALDLLSNNTDVYQIDRRNLTPKVATVSCQPAGGMAKSWLSPLVWFASSSLSMVSMLFNLGQA